MFTLAYAAIFGSTAYAISTGNIPLALAGGLTAVVAVGGSVVNAIRNEGRQSVPSLFFSVAAAGALSAFIGSSGKYRDDARATGGAVLAGLIAAAGNSVSGEKSSLGRVASGVASVGLGALVGSAALVERKEAAIGAAAALTGLLIGAFTSSSTAS